MPMYMVVWFSCECKFVFPELSTVNAETKESNCGLFILGCFLTMLYCVLHMLLASIKPKILKNTLRSKIPLLDNKISNKKEKNQELQLLKSNSNENLNQQSFDNSIEIQDNNIQNEQIQTENQIQIIQQDQNFSEQNNLNNQFGKKIKKNKEIKGYKLDMLDRFRMTVWYFLFSLSNIMLMMLMMTMNGWVELFIAAGLALGYFLFQSSEGQELEQNSCHID